VVELLEKIESRKNSRVLL